MTARPAPTVTEPVLVRYTWTVTGNPLTADEVTAEWGKPAHPAPRGPGWFWTYATPSSADRIRRNGHKAVGRGMLGITSWYPPQTGVAITDDTEPTGDHRTQVLPDGTERVVSL